MKDIETKYGKLQGVIDTVYYSSGKLRSARFDSLNKISILDSEYIPQYGDIETRTKFREAMAFYESGNIKSIYLNEISKVNTSLGEIEAEFITFYDTGEIHRIFPLYGQVSGFWSEEDEMKLAKKNQFDIGDIHIDNKISSYCFYKSGKIKSITLWKDEIIIAKVNKKNIAVRIGASFYETGEIKTMEPYIPTRIKTKLGVIIAYDNQPIGIHGDNNSLKLDKKGRVEGITTPSTSIHITDKEGNTEVVGPKLVRSQIDIEQLAVLPISITINKEEIKIIRGRDNRRFRIEDSKFETEEVKFENISDPCSRCAGCQSH